MKTERKPVSVYVHIPFCVKKCLYCDFLSFPGTAAMMAEYGENLIREISAAVCYLDISNYYVNTIYIGGGTPSIVSETLIEEILCKLAPLLTDDPEISMEVNPGTLKGREGQMKAQVYVRSGINRVSIGLQSADDSVLKRIGRIHDHRDFLETLDILRNAGISNINADIMQDLPDTDHKTYMDTLERVIKLDLRHISSYSLILEEGTPLYEQRDSFTFPDEDEDRRIYRDNCRILKESGFEQYEISNFSKPGFECRHNITYWERGDYLGLGLGASSCMGDVRWKNPSDMGVYGKYTEHLSFACEAADTEHNGLLLFPDNMYSEEVEKLENKDIISETMFLGLRMTRGIDEEVFRRRFGKSLRDIYGRKIDDLIQSGVLSEGEGRLFLTDYGVDVSNLVFEELLL
ncbi:MAG: radical SAM family heme chaperone HemW [Lachnospiraceae bacterium]|nr:radical SAM family heme chaperone HemW [Lachnospiraceae bacterium]